MQFRASVQLDGKTATGGYTYQTTVGRMRGEFKFPVSAAIREQAGLSAGDSVDVELELDNAPRVLDLPADLAKALKADKLAEEAFSKLSYSNRKRHALSVEGAKTPETRQRRIAKVLSELR